MSRSKNKVNWCLDKAKRELSKGQKHRGLVKGDSDIQEAKKHIKKAEHNFRAVLSFEKAGFSDWSVSAIFYTIYHCFLAIITKNGYESRNQECTVALVKYLIEEGKIKIDDEIIYEFENTDHKDRHQSNTIELRENFQYGTETSIEDGRLTEFKEICKKAIDQAKNIVYSS